MIDDFKSSPPVEPPKQNDQPEPQTYQTNPVSEESGGIPLDLSIDKLNQKGKKKRSFHLWPSHLSKKKQIALATFLVLLIGGIIGYFVYTQLFTKNETVSQTPVVQEEPAPPTTVPSTLTGLEVKPEVNERPVTGVMIENSPDARPQSGLTEAGVVFEAVAEGGITRFLALYQEAEPQRIGPVRSARPYYIDWALGFDAAYAHVGGSPDALKKIKRDKVKDLDQFSNAQYYRRIPERYAPHNMYTSMKELDAAKKARGYTKSEFTGFARKKEQAEKTPTVTKIDMSLSSSLYNVSFSYDAKTNSYTRKLAGKAHKDEKSGKAITPKVVIALITTKSNDGKYSVYKTIGGGKVIVFQDGKKIEGMWQKKSRDSNITFSTADGKPLELNPGQTWITALGSTSEVKITEVKPAATNTTNP